MATRPDSSTASRKPPITLLVTLIESRVRPWLAAWTQKVSSVGQLLLRTGLYPHPCQNDLTWYSLPGLVLSTRMSESCRHLRRVIESRESWDFHLWHCTRSLQGYNTRFHDRVNWKSTNQARSISPAADPCPFEELSVASNWLHSNGFQPPMKARIKAIYLSKTCLRRGERGEKKKRGRDMAEKEACPGEWSLTLSQQTTTASSSAASPEILLHSWFRTRSILLPPI